MEGFAGVFPDAGHVIETPQVCGFPGKDDRRNVLPWSKGPWVDIGVVGREGLPSGRFIRAVTKPETATTLSVVGVCILWRWAHCNGGCKGREPRQDHLAWLAEFVRLRSQLPATRLIIFGDFNQRIPRGRAPRIVYEALLQAFEGGEIATTGNLPVAPKSSIDHIAHSLDLPAPGVNVWMDKDTGGRTLSDHSGVWVDSRLSCCGRG
ncbi:MAG: endonuclease/exonuclease/phosphatase family protein [Chloroflexi bacterium]|nr:endonuclease/exonuclease/phosphatase family protein [Chloroflexota bacterium]